MKKEKKQVFSKNNLVLYNQMPSTKHQMNNKGISLIVLVITIIVIMMLTTTAITITVNSGGIFNMANQTTDAWNTAVTTDKQKINEAWNKMMGENSVGET